MTAIGGALEILLNLFMDALDMDLNTYIEMFPFLVTGYNIFRGIGAGLATVLAAVSLLKFFVPAIFGAREPTDTVGGVLIKTLLAGGLIYGGNYILVAIVQIAKIPYDIFLNEAGTGAVVTDFSWDFLTRIAEDLTGVDAAMIVFEFVITLVIAWNIIKLMIEVCERYMMVGILLYTSPPFFAMVASADTADSFRRWAKMFISSCAMMSVSVFFMKLILSGFSIINGGLTMSGAKVFVRLLLMLATCKIAQRADSYLGQLGLGTATTGGPLLDDLVAAARSFGGIFGGAGGGKGGRASVLGTAADAMSKNGGIAGKMTDAIRAGKASYAAGDSMDATLQKIQKAFQDTSRTGMVPNSVKAPYKVMHAGAEASKAAAAEGVKGVSRFTAGASAAGEAAVAEAAGIAAGAAEVINPGLTARREAAIIAGEESSITAAQTNYDYNRDCHEAAETEFAGAAQPYSFTDSHAVRYSGADTKMPTPEEADSNFAMYGAIDPDTGASMNIYSGHLAPTERALASGVGVENNDYAMLSGKIITGKPEAVAEVIAGGYNPCDSIADYGDSLPGGITDEFRDLAVDTVNTGSPVIADRLLHNPNLLIGGTEGLEIGGSAVLKLYPEIAGENTQFVSVCTENRPDVTDGYGNRLSGGHSWTAVVSGNDGFVRYTGIDETAYSSLEVSDRHEYRKRTLPTGRTEYLSRRKIGRDEAVASVKPSEHFKRTEPSRIRGGLGSVFRRGGE